MAFRWRIRYKLMLGLGLVVGIIALLLAGTLYGLASYRGTMKSIDSKLIELREAEGLKAAVNDLAANDANPGLTELPGLRDKIQHAQAALDAYELQLSDTLNRGRDPDQGFEEKGKVEALRAYFAALEKALHRLNQSSVDSGPSKTPMEDREVRGAIHNLMVTTDDLLENLHNDFKRRSDEARQYYRISLWIVLTISVAGVLLLCYLLGFFYRWVFYPIRDLERGAGQVAKGDFEHRIEVHSGDEMEDLAAAFNDMTGRLREMYRDLARQVNERSRQLVRSERLVSVGFLAAGVAHEINNPMHIIAVHSEALERRLAHAPGQSAEEKEVITRYLQVIQKEAIRCKDITERLLNLSRGGDQHREPTNLVELIQAVLDAVQLSQSAKGKRIVFEPPGRVMAWVNATEIKSVVLNLVVNALDSMDDGGTLTITLKQRPGLAEVVFVDTGCGMSAEILENIFEPFFTHSRTGKGTGLGLSISHRIISQHGGEIEAVSPGLNQGSTFTVRLPLQPAEQVKEELLGHAA